MASGSFSVDDDAIRGLQLAMERNADVLADFMPRFRAGAIDGMATAWGDLGEQTRADYLDGAATFVQSIEGVAAALRDVAEVLAKQHQNTAEAERASADVLGSILDRLEGR